MSIHLTNKEIDNFVSGLAPAKDANKIEEHITSCTQCRMIVKSLSSVLSEQPSDSVPGEHVKKAVLAEWHRLHNEIVENNTMLIKTRPRIYKIITGLAVAASIVITVSSYIFLDVVKDNVNYPLTITSASGKVYINDSLAAADNSLKTGDVLRTGIKSSAVISSDGYILYAGRSTSLDIAGSNKKNGIEIILNEGSVISKSSGSIHYSFVCGEYKVIPAGTEFMLQLSRDKLDVAVSQGKVIVTGVNLRIEIPAGMKWSSGIPGGRVDSLDAEKSALINSVNSNIWPYENPSPEDRVNKPAAKDTPKVITEGAKIENNPIDDKKEKMEKTKLNRELRDEMNEIKKEQRREKNGRNKI